MFRFVKSRPGEFLVVGRGGKLQDLGVGAGAWLGPSASFVRVPTGKEEAEFSMVQETADGIPLQFKGSTVYRVVDPVAAALAFDFEDGRGPSHLRALVASVCLAELRDVVSHMTMDDCIEQRKTTLTRAVWDALAAVLEGTGSGESTSWGITLDVVLVAQVYVHDQELRARLEAEDRAVIATRSRRAEIQRDEEIRRTEIASIRRLELEGLERARESNSTAREELKLSQSLALERQASEAQAQEEEALQTEAFESRRAQEKARFVELSYERESALTRRRQEADSALRRAQLEGEREVAELALEVEQRKLERKELEVEQEMLRVRAEAELEQVLLPQRQIPEIAEALAHLYQGANVSIYTADDPLASKVQPLFDMLMQRVRQAGVRDAS